MISGMILRVHEKPDEGSLTILRPALLINWEFFPSLFGLINCQKQRAQFG